MHINSLPVELFVQILNHVSFADDMSIMLVSKTWYGEYQALIKRQAQARFEEILFSERWDWKRYGVPGHCRNIFYYHSFIANKLFSFCRVFNDTMIYARLLKTQNALRKELIEKDKDRMEVDRLMDEFEKSLEYDSWFPDWLWEKHKNTPRHTDCTWKLDHVNDIWKECENQAIKRCISLNRHDLGLSEEEFQRILS